MRIRLPEGTESLHIGVSPRAAIAQLPQVAQLSVAGNVDLSTAVRALTAALEQELLGHTGRQVQDMLLEQDRLLLTWAYQVFTDAGDTEQLGLLARELGRFRVHTAAPQALATALRLSPELGTAPKTLPLRLAELSHAVKEQPLRLPVLGPEDEGLARTILLHLATRESALDRGFVRSLLEPERTVSPLSLRFVHRLVMSLLPRPLARAERIEGLLARRDAHLALATALRSLDLSLAHVEAVQPEQLARGIERVSRALTDLSLEARASQASLRPLAALTRDDRAVLVLFHAALEARGDAGAVLEVFTRALLTLRSTEQADLTASRLAPEQPLREDELSPGGEHAAPSRPVPDAKPAESRAVPSGEHTDLTASNAAVEAEPDPRGADAAGSAPSERAATRADAPTARTDAATTLGYESRSQLAARATRGYHTLLPPRVADAIALPSVDLSAPTARDTSLPRANESDPVHAFVRPLDLSQSLGLGALVGQLHARALRAGRARLRRRHANIIRALRAIGRRRTRRDPEDAANERRRRSSDVPTQAK